MFRGKINCIDYGGLPAFYKQTIEAVD